MAQQAMYPALANSPGTEIATELTSAAVIISVLDASKLPAAPNLLTIGTDDNPETVLYTGKSGNNLTGCTRGFNGTTAQSWIVGSKVARYFTAYDHDAFRGNITDHESRIESIKETANAAATKAETDEKFTVVNEQLADATNGSFIQEDDVSKIKALAENNKPIRGAIVGDSTKAGPGWRFGPSDTGYAECGDIDKPTSPEIFFLNLLKGSPYFIKPNEDIGGALALSKLGATTSYVGAQATSIYWDRYVMTYGIGYPVTSISLTFNHMAVKRNKLSIYYLVRTSDAAAKIDVVCNGVTTTIDSYKAPQSFGAITGIAQQGFTLFVAVIAIPTTGDTFSVTVNNARAGGSPTASASGTFNIVGFFYGEALIFRNYSIRSTTLDNNSAQNQSKGVTTTERLQKAYDFGANVFYLGWGTNDANLTHTTPEKFAADLSQRIDEIRATVPGAVIIIDSAYPGSNGAYSNVAHFVAAKAVALAKKCSFLDVANILLKFPQSEVINDYVHPNEYGYRVVGEAMSYLFGTTNSAAVQAKTNNKQIASAASTAIEVHATGGETNTTLVDNTIFTSTFTALTSKLYISFKLAVDANAEQGARFSIVVNGLEIDFARHYNTGQQAAVTSLALASVTKNSSVTVELRGQNYKLSLSGVSSKMVILQV